jgi:hypothetical protein
MNCQVDWSATGDMLQGIGAIISGLAIILAAWLGADTYKKWKRQKIAERKIEHSESILVSTYKVRRELSFVRSPMMWVHELEAAEKN